MTALQFCKEFWVNIKPRLPSVLPLKQHCPTCRDHLNTLKSTSANTIPTMLGDVAPTCCVRLHGALQFDPFSEMDKEVIRSANKNENLKTT